jgi:hypothetical protein
MRLWIIVGIISLLLFGYADVGQSASIVVPKLQKISYVNLVKGIAAPSDVQSKLKAIEDAHNAGILTDEEYKSKKAELEATTISEEANKKLQALESAYQSGILTKEEYERKKAELLGQGIVTPSEIKNLTLYSDPIWEFQFQYPPDWEIQAFPNGQGVALTKGNANINLLLFLGSPEPKQLIESVATQIQGQWEDYRQIGTVEDKYEGRSVLEFTGVNPKGMKAHAQLSALASGGMAYVFLMSTPENEFNDALPVWEALLKSFKPIKDGKIYRHEGVLSFWYPADWSIDNQKVLEIEDYVPLTPPNAGKMGDAPTELYFLFAQNMGEEKIDNPKDQRIIDYMDTQIQSLSPALKRTGEPLSIGSGILLEWIAKSPEGNVIKARTYTKVANNILIALISVGLGELLDSRDADLRRMFLSLDLDEAPTSTEQEGQGSSMSSSGEVGDQNWGFKFLPPEGWKSQKTSEAIILGHDTIAGVIVILPHALSNIQQVQQQMEAGLSEEGVQLSLDGKIQNLGSYVVGEYAGIVDNAQAKARSIGTLSPYGGGAFIIAVSTPDKYSNELSSAAEAIAKKMQYFKVEASDLMQNFAGTWTNYTTNTATKITLAPNGDYFDHYEASHSGNFKDGAGNDTGNWGTANQNQGQGRWAVSGNRQQGKIVIRLRDGGENVLNYKVHEEKGRTYWNEYWFNGQLYGKNIK